LQDETLRQAVVFTRTKRRADRLATRLSRGGYKAAPLHGDMRQGARKKTIAKMKSGEVSILVATDVAARGLDIKEISHVINMDLPMVAEDYIHRIGRTGRAGASGMAASFVSAEEWELLTAIQKLTGWELPREMIPGLEARSQEPRKGNRSSPPSKKSKSKPKRNRRRRGPDHQGGGAAAKKKAAPGAKKRTFRRPPSKKRSRRQPRAGRAAN
jgi:ATP-dependent RNA helicase RhlE